MKRLWHYWRRNLVKNYIKPAGSKEAALKKVPQNILEDDWKWLANEHFFHPDFLKVRNRNSENRSYLTMLHRTGITPFRQIMYDEMGGKEGKMPTIAEVFKRTRQQKSGALDEESASKHEEIIKKSKENPEFSVFELVEECFGPQDRDHVACFGYGMKPKDVRGPLPSTAELQAMLRDKEKKNTSLLKRMDAMETNYKSGMSKVEGELKMVVDILKTSQPQLDPSMFGATFGSAGADSQND